MIVSGLPNSCWRKRNSVIRWSKAKSCYCSSTNTKSIHIASGWSNFSFGFRIRKGKFEWTRVILEFKYLCFIKYFVIICSLRAFLPNFMIGCSRRFGCSSRRTNFYYHCAQIKYCNPFWCHFRHLARTGCRERNSLSTLGK